MWNGCDLWKTREREKNLWLPWPRISLSCRRQGQDLTLGRWLVDIFSNTQANLIGLFNCNYRGDAEDFHTSFLKVNFASLYRWRKLFVYCTRNNICTGPRHVKARHVSRFWHGCCSWKNIRRNFDLGTWWALSWGRKSEQQKKAFFAAVSRKDVFTILPTGHGKSIIFQLLPDVYLSLRGYWYPRRAIILVVSTLKSLVNSHIRELRKWPLSNQFE